MDDKEIFGGLLNGPAKSDDEAPVEVVDLTIELDFDDEHYKFKPEHTLYSPGERVVNARVDLLKAQHRSSELQLIKDGLAKTQLEIKRRFEAEMRDVDQRMEIVNNDLWTLRRQIRALQMAVQQAENALRVALANLKARREFLDNAKEFDTLTLGMSWREWALEHQLDGAKFLATAERGILADKMGLGKTLTSLITADMRKVKKLLVVVPDDVVTNFAREIAHWAPHRTAVVIGKRSKGEREAILSVLDSLQEFTVVINYSAWRKDRSLLSSLVGLRFEMVIIDEAHTIKTTATSAFLGCKQLVLSENSCPECRGKIQRVTNNNLAPVRAMKPNVYIPKDYYCCIGHDAKAIAAEIKVDEVNLSKSCGWNQLRDILDDVNREYGALRSVRYLVPMTGTPILNSPTDLFPLLNLISDNTWNNKNEFVREYCARNPYNNRIEFKYGGLERLVKMLGTRYIGRDRDTAGVVLPKQEVRYHDIDFDRDKYPLQYNVIKQLTKHAAIMLESGKTMPVLAQIALITRKRQANVWPAGINMKDEDDNILFSVGDEVQESIKLDYIIEEPATTESGEWEGMIPDLTGMGDITNGDRVIVFSQFKGPLKELERRLNKAGISCVRFDGDTTDEIADQVKLDFDRQYIKNNPEYQPKWQVCLANYRTGGVGLNFTAAVQVISLDSEWSPGKNEQSWGRVDRIGQTEESIVHVLRLAGTIDQWMDELIENKRDMIEGFNTNIQAQDILAMLAKEDEI
jgi:SNF2 family DNA or RNA helicase